MNPLSSEWLAEFLDRRPVLVAIAGPNGAGKSTFFRSFLEDSGLTFVNADVLAVEHGLDAYNAASLADSIRREMVALRQSFVMETVFSDPAGDKVAFLRQAAEIGYSVVLFFIGITGPEISEERVALRVMQGGHDVSTDKLNQRYPRILKNLEAAILALPHIFIFDNSDLRSPYRLAAIYENGKGSYIDEARPAWLQPILP
jgi:predicted ABC-type ATPase